MSFQKLIVISDEMIKSSDSSFFSLHHFKEERGRGLARFKDMDGLKIRGNQIDLVEFKRCDLFYKENLDSKDLKKVEEITSHLPEKINDSILVLLPEYLENFRINSNFKINIYLVLGDEKPIDDQKSRGREREAIIRRTKNYEKIEKIVKRYRGTAFVKNAEIMTRSKFIGKFSIVVE